MVVVQGLTQGDSSVYWVMGVVAVVVGNLALVLVGSLAALVLVDNLAALGLVGSLVALVMVDSLAALVMVDSLAALAMAGNLALGLVDNPWAVVVDDIHQWYIQFQESSFL